MVADRSSWVGGSPERPALLNGGLTQRRKDRKEPQETPRFVRVLTSPAIQSVPAVLGGLGILAVSTLSFLPGGAAVFRWQLDPKRANLAEEGALVETQILCGGQAVVAVAAQGVLDRMRFYGPDRGLHIAVCRSSRGDASQQVLRQTGGFDPVAVTEHKGMLDDILQLTYVAGKIVRHQQRHHVGPNAFDRAALQAVESGNEKVLEGLRKGIKLPRVKEVFAWCRELGITTLADFMIGSPGEGLREINDTLRFVKSIKPNYVQFCITCPYPATPLYKKLLEGGRITRDVWLEFVENPSINFIPPLASEYFNREQLKTLVVRAYKKSYFTLPFIIKEIKKIRSMELLLSRVRTALSLLKGT